MSFARYPAYKDSGVEWLGEVPAHWHLKPLWTCFRRVKRTGYEDEQLLSVYRDFGVVPKASRDDNFNNASEDLGVYQLVEPGDLAINKMKAWQGSVAISEHRGIVSPAYFIYESTHQEHARYLHYLMRSVRFITAYLSVSKGIRIGQWDLEPQYHSRLPLVLPPSPEQTAIADFLDRETAKIDALVAEQQRLIELLKEKRQAVVSHAVTKGLNPDAPMKPSGVEWLGEVPAHWSVRKLLNLARIESGHTPSRQHPEWWIEDECTIPWFTLADVGFLRDPRNVHITTTSQKISEIGMANSAARLLPIGTVLLSRTASVGFSGVTTIVLAVSQDFAAWVCGPSLRPSFLLLCLRAMTQEFDRLKMGSTHQTIYMPDIEAFRVPVPSLSEQQALEAFVEGEMRRIDDLTAEAQHAIDLLTERRISLISAAVTGQIDVRPLTERTTA